MWSTDTYWFEMTVVLAIFAVGNILFGHFEEHRPKWRRLLKVVIVLVLAVGLSGSLGRGWAFGALVLPLTAAAVIHLWWLPRNGVNGWTGEPRDRYYALIGHTPPETAAHSEPPVTGADLP